MASYVLHVGGGEYSDIPVQSSLPPFHIILVDDVDDVARLDGQFVTFIGIISIQYPALTHSWREGGGRGEAQRGEEEKKGTLGKGERGERRGERRREMWGEKEERENEGVGVEMQE